MFKKQTALGIILLVVLVLLAWFIFGTIFSWLKSQDPTVIATFTTAIFGLSGHWFAQWHSKSRNIAEIIKQPTDEEPKEINLPVSQP